MKISLNWLKEIIDIDCPVDELSKILTNCGLEVEGIEEFESVKGGLKGVVIGEVLTCGDHPDSDHLHVTTVDVGGERPLDIVCGAANVAAGQKVVVATSGTIIYSDKGDFEIKKSKIRGQVSEGMICAEDELGLGTSHAGIMVLPNDAPIGMPAADYFKIERDTVFEIGLTPNRNDATGHIGVARDIAAVQSLKFQVSGFRFQIQSGKDVAPCANKNITVSVIDSDACPRYSGITLKNVKVKNSPDWLQNRLKAVGIRPINNVVDVTNFILMHYGQPLHAFDLQEVKGNKIIVKKLPKDSIFRTLDGIDRKLNGEELMICNAEEGMCIAGVFGGEKSGVKDTTTDIFIESAYFNPVSIRKTSKYHGLKTDASFRYERGCDPNITVEALKHAVALLQDIADAEISSDIIDIYPQKIERKEITLNFNKLNEIIGVEIPREKVMCILECLDFIENQEPKTKNQDTCLLKIPTNKADVTREIDVIEEIIRIYGFDNIEQKGQTKICFAENPKPNKEDVYNQIAERLVGIGFDEIMNNSLISSDISAKIKGFAPHLDVKMANPLSSEMSVMRQSLLFGALTNIAYNINRRNADLKFFEFGNVYAENPNASGEDNVAKQFVHTHKLGIFITGNTSEESWQKKQKIVDFEYLKSVVNLIFKSLHLTSFNLKSEIPEYFDYGITYLLNEKPIAVLGKISNTTAKYFDIKQEVYFAELDWDLILKFISKKPVSFTELPKFPSVRRDLALLLDKKTTFAQVEEIAYRTEKKLLKEVMLFDVYEGDKLPEGKKSYAVAFILQDASQTMSEKSISGIMNKLMYQYKNLLGAEIR